MPPSDDFDATEGRPDPEDHRPEILDAARRALAAVREGDDTDAVQRLVDVVSGSPEGRDITRDLVLLLFKECSEMVTTLGSGGEAPVKMQVFDAEGQEVPIDRADPPVRTAVRTLLAEVHGDSDAAQDQVEIALSNGAPDEMATVVLQALRWTIRLATECATRELPVPEWIDDVLDG